MNIEQLSKSQLLLLTLLVSFVTSIATGIVIISLLEEAPQTVTQTVNRVVERTIERVAQPAVSATQGAAVITKEKTVIVQEKDVLSDAITKHAERVVSIQIEATSTPPIASGLFLPNQGLIATASIALAAEKTIFINFADNLQFEAVVVYQDEDTGITFLEPILPEGITLPTVAPYEFATIESAHRGQSILVLTTRGAVQTGIVSFVGDTSIETNLDQNSVPYGATLITNAGDIMGMHVAVKEGSDAVFIESRKIVSALNAYNVSLAEVAPVEVLSN